MNHDHRSLTGDPENDRLATPARGLDGGLLPKAAQYGHMMPGAAPYAHDRYRPSMDGMKPQGAAPVGMRPPQRGFVPHAMGAPDYGPQAPCAMPGGAAGPVPPGCGMPAGKMFPPMEGCGMPMGYPMGPRNMMRVMPPYPGLMPPNFGYPSGMPPMKMPPMPKPWPVLPDAWKRAAPAKVALYVLKAVGLGKDADLTPEQQRATPWFAGCNINSVNHVAKGVLVSEGAPGAPRAEAPVYYVNREQYNNRILLLLDESLQPRERA